MKKLAVGFAIILLIALAMPVLAAPGKEPSSNSENSVAGITSGYALQICLNTAPSFTGYSEIGQSMKLGQGVCYLNGLSEVAKFWKPA